MVRRRSWILGSLLVLLLAAGGCAARQRVVTAEGPSSEAPPQPASTAQARAAPQRSEVGEGPIPAGPPQATARKPDLEDIFFAFDRYALTEQAKQVLRANAEFLLQHPQARVLIEGHADERGTTEYNLALGEKRALAAREYLIALGVEPNRLSTISYGEERPLDPRHNEEAWSRNRRDHFTIVSQ